MSEAEATSDQINVVIIDDHAMFRDSLTLALDRADDIHVAGSAGSIAGANAVFARTSADVAVIDYGLPDGTGVELAALLHERDDPPRTLILTASEGPQAAAEAVGAGCTGFVRKSADISQLLRAVRLAAAGEAMFDTQTLSSAIAWLNRSAHAPTVELTDREIEVLALLAEGRSTPEIGETLYVSPHTVRNHIRNTLSKLNARSQLEGVVIAASLGLVRVGRADVYEED